MTSWRSRLGMGLLIAVFMAIHDSATETLPNTPEAMLLFHGSAALLDWLLLWIAPRLLSGPLCDRTQWLLLYSIVGNATGWALYMSYASPIYYNVSMWALTIVQFGVLIMPTRHDDNNSWINLVHGASRLGGGNDFGKA